MAQTARLILRWPAPKQFLAKATFRQHQSAQCRLVSHQVVETPTHNASTNQAASGKKEPLEIMHAAAEATGLPSNSVDLVSMCLVAHELPQVATRAILREAFRWEAGCGGRGVAGCGALACNQRT